MGVFLEIRKRPFLLGLNIFNFLSKTLLMNKNETNFRLNLGTLRFALRGTNRGVYAHFHAG